MLAMLAHARHEDGAPMTRDEIADMEMDVVLTRLAMERTRIARIVRRQTDEFPFPIEDGRIYFAGDTR